jgi:ProP effector
MTETVPDPAAQPADAPDDAVTPSTTSGSGASGAAGSTAAPPTTKPRGRAKNAGRTASAPRAPHPVLQRLFELYPKMFGARFLPLKLGVFQELLALHPEEFKKEELKLALGLHARSTRYLESIAAGEKRHDLNGQPVEDVAPEHVHHAILEVFRRRQARSREDLRPWLRERLVQAIDNSGLSREAYAERVRSQDPLAVQSLEEAFAEVGERAARREALRRAYETSGRTPAEFAEMYGMDPAVVERALAP